MRAVWFLGLFWIGLAMAQEPNLFEWQTQWRQRLNEPLRSLQQQQRQIQQLRNQPGLDMQATAAITNLSRLLNQAQRSLRDAQSQVNMAQNLNNGQQGLQSALDRYNRLQAQIQPAIERTNTALKASTEQFKQQQQSQQQAFGSSKLITWAEEQIEELPYTLRKVRNKPCAKAVRSKLEAVAEAAALARRRHEDARLIADPFQKEQAEIASEKASEAMKEAIKAINLCTGAETAKDED